MAKKPTYEELEQRVKELEKEAMELRSKEKRLRIMDNAVASSINAIGITDLQGKLIYVNDSCIKMWGYEHEKEMIGRSLPEFWEGDGIFYTIKELQERGVASGDDIGKRKDGSLFNARFSASIFKDETGNPAYMFGSFFDISDRKQAEKALRESEERFRELAELLPETIYEMDATGNLTFVNRNAFDHFGYTQQDLDQGLNGLNMIVPEERSRAIENITKILNGENIALNEYTALRKDGSTFPAMFRSTAIIREEKPVGLRGFIIDITERKKAEEALRESEAKYRTLVEQSLQGILVLQDNRIVYANEAFASISGYSTGELLALSPEKVAAMINPDDQELVWGRLRDRLQGKMVPQIYQYRGIRKDGSESWLEMYASVIMFNGRPAVQAALMDISESKRAGEALQFTQFAIDSFSDPAFWMGQDARFIYVNEAACSVLGYSREELLELTVHDIDPDFPKERWADHWDDIKRRGSFIIESHHRTKAGRAFPVEIKVNYLEFDGKAYNCAFARDVSERKRTEEALHKEEEKFRVLVEESPLGIAFIGQDGTYQYLNPKFSEMFGYTLSDIPTGREWFRKAYPNPEYRNEVISIWVSDLKMSRIGESRPRSFNVRCKDGSEKEIFFRPVSMESGEQFILCEDITDRKRLETQLLQAQKMEAMGTLAGGIAHDFNNILSAIIMYTEMSLLDISEEMPVRYNLEQVLISSDRAKELVKQILAFSRQSEQEMMPINITPVIKESLKLLRASIPSTIEIQKNLSVKNETVLADPTQIQQILMNLCTNAAHAMGDAGGILDVRLEDVSLDERHVIQFPDLSPGPHLKLTVSDTGHGMTGSIMERIFDPYFTTKDKGVGTGLGLAIISGIIKSLGGAINVESKMGKGSTFRVYFPVIKKVAVSKVASEKPLIGGHECILLIQTSAKSPKD